MEILRIDLDDNGVYANISFVDFVSLAMSLTLYTATSSERSPQLWSAGATARPAQPPLLRSVFMPRDYPCALRPVASISGTANF